MRSAERSITSVDKSLPSPNVPVAGKQVQSRISCTEPDHGLARGWKPLSLRTKVLVGNFFVTFSVVIVLAFLQYRSIKSGGVLFADTEDDLGAGATFLYLYLPTIIAVIYSLMWSCTDFDIKRLEPWFQLASKESSKPNKPLLLQYPVDFLALVPFRAARARYVS